MRLPADVVTALAEARRACDGLGSTDALHPPLLAAKLSLQSDRVVIPVPTHSRPRLHKLRSVHAAIHGLPAEIRIIDHQLDLGFALTDFKLQSKTKTKLIISMGPRKFRPYFSLSTVYVLASRVKKGHQIRVIGFDPQRDGIGHLTSLQHPAVLGIWEAAYDDGEWSAERCRAAIDAALGGERPTPLDELAADPDEDDMVEA